VSGISREKRFDGERLVRLTTISIQDPGISTRAVFDDLIHLNDHDRVVESRSLHDDRCVFCIRSRKKIAFAVRLLCTHKDDVWDDDKQATYNST
jgi:hypothetical protein